MKIRYDFTGKLWQHSSPGGWYFISVPQELAQEIRGSHKWQEEGWGRLKANAKIRNQEWDTAIWFDTKRNTYILPVKSELRKKEQLTTDTSIDVTIWL